MRKGYNAINFFEFVVHPYSLNRNVSKNISTDFFLNYVCYFQNVPESFFVDRALKQQQTEKLNVSAPIEIIRVTNGESSPIITPTRKEGFLDKCKYRTI